MMLMHHSRNTEQKQWDETLVLALAGASKVLRSFLPVIVKLQGFQQVGGGACGVGGWVGGIGCAGHSACVRGGGGGGGGGHPALGGVGWHEPGARLAWGGTMRQAWGDTMRQAWGDTMRQAWGGTMRQAWGSSVVP